MDKNFFKLDPEICVVYTYMIYNCPLFSNEFDIRRDYRGVIRADLFYVGQIHSKNPYKMRLRHKEHMRKDRHHQKVDCYLQTHLFDYDCLWLGYIEDVDASERYFIDLFDSYGILNLESGGSGCKTVSEEVRMKLSIKQIENWQNPDFRKNQCSALKEWWAHPANHASRVGENNILCGVSHTEEHNKKISIAHLKNWQNEEYRNTHIKSCQSRKGCVLPESEKTQISCKVKELWQDEEYRLKHTGENHHFYGKRGSEIKWSKPIAQYDLEGNIIDSFESIIDAERKTGISRRRIRYELNNKGLKHNTGYIWEYINTNNVT